MATTYRAAARRWPYLLVLLLSCLALVWTGLPPAEAAPRTPSAPVPSAPAPSAPVGGPAQREAPTPPFEPVKGRPNSVKLIRSLSPADDAFVSGRALKVRVRLARSTKLDTVRLDGRLVTKYLKRSGRTWSGRVPKVGAGLVHLRVTAKKGKKQGLRSTRFTIRGERTDLLSELPVDSGVLGAAQQPGVSTVAVASNPDATFVSTVNGHPVGEDVLGRAEAGGARRFVVSRTDGLRRGRNVIISKAFLDDGRYETIRRVVRVPKGTPLAEAGPGGTFEQGEVVRLDGSGSRPARNKGRLTYSWRLVQAPDGAAPLTSPTARKASLRMAAPGRYVVALTVTERRGGRSHSSTDLVNLLQEATTPPIGARIATLTTNTDKLPPAVAGADTNGIGMVYDGKFRSFASDFVDGGVTSAAGLYSIDPLTLRLNLVKSLFGDDLDAAVAGALSDDGKVAKGEILVLEVPAKGSWSSNHVKQVPFSHVVTYDGKGATNFWDDGSTNAGVQLQTGGAGLDPAGSLSGYLRVATDPDPSSKVETSRFRFVRDAGHIAYSTSVSRVATTGANSGAVYRLVSTTSALAVTSQAGSSDVRLDERSADEGQQWQLIAAYAGFYTLTDEETGRCLTTRDSAVVVDACDPRGDSTAQLWFPQYDSGTGAGSDQGAYRLVPALTPIDQAYTRGERSALTPDGDSGLKLAPSGTPDQLWKLDVPPGVYTIRFASQPSPDAGKVLSETDYATNPEEQLKVLPETGELTQRWRVVDQPGDGAGSQRFSLVNLASGQCADAYGAPDASGYPVNRYPCKPSDDATRNQQWEPVGKPSGVELHVAPADGATGEQGALAVGAGQLVVKKNLDSQSRDTQVWSLERAVEPAAGDLATMVVADGTGRSLQQEQVGSKLTRAVKTAGPTDQSRSWRLAPTAADEVQLQDPAGTHCLFDDGSVGDCGDKEEAVTGTEHDGTWTFHLGSRALVVNSNGVLSLSSDSSGTPFEAVGQSNTMRVRGQQFRTTAGLGQSGFSVLAFDQTLRPLDGYPRTFVTNGWGSDKGASLAAALNTLGETAYATVLLQSFGAPRPESAEWNGIAEDLLKLGIDDRKVLGLDGGRGFAAAGCAQCEDAPEADDGADWTGGGARLEGELGWTLNSTRAPLNGATLPVEQGLTVLAERERTAWPFEDPASAENKAVLAIHDALEGALNFGGGTCGVGDKLRNTYCNGGEASAWDGPINALEALDFETATKSGTGYDETEFTLVKKTLLREFSEVRQVHELFDTLQALIARDSLNNAAAFSSNGLAQGVKDTIYQPHGPTPTTTPPNNPANVGGWADVIGAGMLVLKDVAPFVLAAPRSGVGDEPTEEAGSAYDVVADGFLLFATLIELGGGDDGSRDSGLDVEAPLQEYEAELADKLAHAANNLNGIRDMVLTDPASLNDAAQNSQYGTWQLATNQQRAITTTFSTAIVRDLWPRELGVGYQLWRWPRLPAGYTVGTIFALTNQEDYVYKGQADGGSVLPVVRVDDSGLVASRATYVLTRTIADDDFTRKEDRIARASFMDEFYKQTGLTPSDLPALDPLRRKPCDTAWPFTKLAKYQVAQNVTGASKDLKSSSTTFYFGDKDRKNLKDWTDSECSN